MPLQSAYSASKAGLDAVSEGLRRELKPFGIDVVIITPGVLRALQLTYSRHRMFIPSMLLTTLAILLLQPLMRDHRLS